MIDKEKLPEGITPVEYIEYRPKQETMFMFGHFEKFKDAQELANRINSSCEEETCQVNCFQTPDNVLFGVVFPEHILEKIDYIKREECTIFNPPTEVIYNIPMLYRFIEEQYVDSFFETGVLKLTTFEKCKELEDTNRKDTKEGQSDLYGYDGKYKMQIGIGVGSDTIMLCTSLCSQYVNDEGKVFNKYIEIFDVQGLLFAISDQLSMMGYKVLKILYGPCFYSSKEFHKGINFEKFRKKLDEEKVFDWDEMVKLTNGISGPNIYFQKPYDKRLENEFRLLWIVDSLKNNEDVFVTIPHPEAYCRLINMNKNHDLDCEGGERKFAGANLSPKV